MDKNFENQAAEDLSEQFGGESIFTDDETETTEQPEEEAEESVDEVAEDIEETEEGEEVSEDDDTDEPDRKEEVASNHLKALREERGLRKEAAKRAEDAETRINQYEIQAKNSQDDYDSLVKQIEDNDLTDIIKVQKKPELPQEIQALLERDKQQEAERKLQTVVNDVRMEVKTRMDDYKHIDFKSEKLGNLVMRDVLVRMNDGIEVDEAVESSLNDLESVLKENATAQRKPAVKPVRKAQRGSRPQHRAGESGQRARQKAQQTGDFRDVFLNIAKQHLE